MNRIQKSLYSLTIQQTNIESRKSFIKRAGKAACKGRNLFLGALIAAGVGASACGQTSQNTLNTQPTASLCQMNYKNTLPPDTLVGSPAVLLEGDNPEAIAGPGILMETALPSQKTVQIYTYHDNKGKDTLVEKTEILNPSNFTESAYIIGASGESLYGNEAGYQTQQRYFNALQKESHGSFVNCQNGQPVEYSLNVNIPPHSSIILSSQPISSSWTINQIFTITPLSQKNGENLKFVQEVENPNTNNNSHSKSTPLQILSSQGKVGKGSFPAVLQKNLEYSTQEKDPSILIGNVTFHDPKDGTVDIGPYGATYNIRAALQNPSSNPSPISASLTPLVRGKGATTAGVFRWQMEGGSSWHLSILKPSTAGRSNTILKTTLPPHSKETLVLQTMLVGGSFYPAKVTIAG